MDIIIRLVAIILLVVQFGMLAPEAESSRGVHAIEVEDINEAALQKSIAERQARTEAAKLTEQQRIAAQQDIAAKKLQIEELQDNIKDLQSEAEIEEANRLIDLLQKDIALTVFDVADSLYADNTSNPVAAASRQEAAQDLFDVGAGSKYSDSVVPDVVKDLEKNRKSLATDVTNLIQDASTAVSVVEADQKVVAANNDATQAARNLGLSVAVGDHEPTTAQMLRTDLSAKTPVEVDTNIEKIVKNKRDLRAIFDAAVEKIKEIVKNARADKTTTFSKIDAMEQAQRNFVDKAQRAVKDAFDASLVAVKHTFDRISGKSFEPRSVEELYVAAATNNINSIRVSIKNAESGTVRVLKNYNQAKNEFEELSERLYDNTTVMTKYDLSSNKPLAERELEAQEIKKGLALYKADLEAARTMANPFSDELEAFKNALEQNKKYLTSLNAYRSPGISSTGGAGLGAKEAFKFTYLLNFGTETGALQDFFGNLAHTANNVEVAYKNETNRNAIDQREYFMRKNADGTLMSLSEYKKFKNDTQNAAGKKAYEDKLKAYANLIKNTGEHAKFIEAFDQISRVTEFNDFGQMYELFKDPVFLKTAEIYEGTGIFPELTPDTVVTNLNLIADIDVQKMALDDAESNMLTLNALIDDAIGRIDALTGWIDAGTWRTSK